MIPLLHFTNGSVFVVVELVHTDTAKVATVRKSTVVVEHVPLAFVASDASVHRVTIGTIKEYSLVIPRS